MRYSLYAGRVLNAGSRITQGVRIDVVDGVISTVATDRSPSDEDIKLPNAICCPALINAHDHLKYTWPVRVSSELSCVDSYEWLPKLYREAEAGFLRLLDLETLYWLGVYKNLLAGVATVANHSRRLPAAFLAQFPLRILEDFAREIFVRPDSRAHQMGLGPEKEIELAKDEDLPFVVHIAEGVNHGTEKEVEILRKMGGLFSGAVLVHGISLSPEDIKEIAQAEASLVWCPASNEFLFGATAPIRMLLDGNVNVALGTDSTCTGSVSLLEEIRLAIKKLEQFMTRKAAARRVFEFVTTNSARAYKKDKLGMIEPGCSADFLVFETECSDPFIGLTEMEPQQIVLLTCFGKWLLADKSCALRIPCAANLNSEVTLYGLRKWVVGDPQGLVSCVARRSERARSFFPLGRALGESD